MNNRKDFKFVMLELYLARAENVSDRRAQANSWMLSVTRWLFTLQVIRLHLHWATRRFSVPVVRRSI
jgi:hypothetical protein